VLNRDIYFHMLFIDGAYTNGSDESVRFRWVRSSTGQELTIFRVKVKNLKPPKLLLSKTTGLDHFPIQVIFHVWPLRETALCINSDISGFSKPVVEVIEFPLWWLNKLTPHSFGLSPKWTKGSFPTNCGHRL